MECDLDGVRLHYRVSGSGTPVIMIHGFSLDHHSMASCMEPVFSGRPEAWMRIYLDLPGMGASPAPSWPGSSDRLLQVILDFIDRVVPGRAFLLAGDSYGGYLARGVLRQRPHQVLGLLLICPVVLAQASERDVPPLTVLVREPSLTGRLTEEQRKEFAAAMVVQTEETWQRFRETIAPAVSRGDPGFLEGLHGERYPFSFDVDELEEPFLEPTLILLGRQDAVVGYRDAWKLLVHYPRASFVILDRAGHSLEIEQEGLFRVLAGEWLDRVSEESARRQAEGTPAGAAT
jgi:pimeloyl-ACP methyl ester carboxylesterase